jgi:hypothetical protein
MQHHWLPSEIVMCSLGVSIVIVVEIMIVNGIRDFIRWKSYGMAWLGTFFLLAVPALLTALTLNALGM